MRGDSISYIRTYTGGVFWPLDPHIDDVKIEDVAHALSLQCRWTGHVKQHFSVAQHCCLVSDLLPQRLKLTGLLHDASEAYLSDLARPVKHAPGLGEIYLQVEAKLEKVLAEKFSLIYPYPKEIKEADNKMLLAEKRDLMEGEWVEPHVDGEGIDEVGLLVPWSTERAEREFLERFYLLTGNSSSRSINSEGTVGRVSSSAENDSFVDARNTSGADHGVGGEVTRD